MDHEQSIESRAAEGYLLGELSPMVREEFEQHFFVCAECAEEVRLGFQFSQNLKSVFHEERRAKNPRTIPTAGGRRFASLWAAAKVPLAACLAIAAFSGYQNAVQIPALRVRAASLVAPRVLSPLVLAPASRAETRSVVVPPGQEFLPVSLAPGAARTAARYECRLQSDSGKTLWRIPVKALEADADLTILFPAADLVTGNYEATLTGITGEDTVELDHYRFSVRRE